MDIVTAKLVPVGATLIDSYWTVPNAYSEGPRFETEELAIAGGIEKIRAAIEQHQAARGAASVPIPERFSVDLRWKLTYPAGGGLDAVAARTTYDSIAEAEESLARRARYRGAGA